MKSKTLFIMGLSFWMVSWVARTSLFAAESGPVHAIDATWGGHESLQSCAPCHGDRIKPETTQSTQSVELLAPIPELCSRCHKEFAVLDGWVHGPVTTGDCLLCHVSHQSRYPSLLKQPVTVLCAQCHDNESLQQINVHAGQRGSQCLTCHDGHNSPGRMLLTPSYLSSDAGRAYLKENPFARPRATLVNQRESLHGLEGVEIVAEVENSPLFVRYGLTEAKVQSLVEQQLQVQGIPIVTREEPPPHTAWLHVSLLLMEMPSSRPTQSIDILTGSLRLSLQQTVELAPVKDQPRMCQATTWETGGIVIWRTLRVHEGLQQAIEALVGQFGSDYQKANPAAP